METETENNTAETPFDSAVALIGRYVLSLSAQNLEEEIYISLAQAVAKEMETRLAKKYSLESCQPAFSLAGAFTVLGLLQDGGSLQKFTVGDFSLTRNAEEVSYFHRAEQLMKPYVKSGEFGFFSV